MTSKFDWGIYGKGGSFSKVEDQSNNIELVMESFEVTDPISAELSCLRLGDTILDTPVLHKSNNMAKDKRDDEDIYCIVCTVKDKYLLSLNP